MFAEYTDTRCWRLDCWQYQDSFWDFRSKRNAGKYRILFMIDRQSVGW